MVAASKRRDDELTFLEELPWDCPDPRPSGAARDLARQALDIMKEKALAPTNMVSSARGGSLGGIWMYFWDGSSYADLEFYNDGRVVLCFNTPGEGDDEESADITDRWSTTGGSPRAAATR